MNISLANAIEKASAYSPCPRTTSTAPSSAAPAEPRAAPATRAILYEGYGPARRGDHRRGAHRQQEPLGRRGAQHLHQARRQPRRSPGAVAWVFERRGSIIVDAAKYGEDDVMAAAIDAGADDVTVDGDDVRGAHRARRRSTPVREALDAAGIECEQRRAHDDPQDHGQARREPTPARP